MSGGTVDYDYAIVGGGPSGLTLAWYLSKVRKNDSETFSNRVLVLEKNNEIGGNHGVYRVNGLFAEHGPRIYLGNYVNFMNLLASMKISFNRIFVKTHSIFSGKVSFSLSEIASLSKAYVKYFLWSKVYHKMSVEQFMVNNNFSVKGKELMNAICLNVDGAGADRMTMRQFLEIINQNAFYNVYQPRGPNDILLLPLWHQQLIQTGNVDIITGSQVIELKGNELSVKEISFQNIKKYTAKTFIFAIPPTEVIKILPMPEKYVRFAENSQYHNYIPVTFHWNTKVSSLKEVSGFSADQWGLSWTFMTKTKFKESQMVASVAISQCDKPSQKTFKSAHQSTKEELLAEVFRQLNEQHDNKLIEPQHSLLSPTIERINGQWIDQNTSFVLTTEEGFSPIVEVTKNIYLLGPQNGSYTSNYSFVSLESAVINAISLYNRLQPENQIDIQFGLSLFGLIKSVIIAILLVLFAVCLRRQSKSQKMFFDAQN